MKLKDFWIGDMQQAQAAKCESRICTACRKRILKLSVECPFCGEEVLENKHLREVAAIQTPESQEKVLLSAVGTNGVVEMFEERIRIRRKGSLSFFTHGLQGEKDILISRLSSIQPKKCGELTKGYIQFAFMGGAEAKSGVWEAAADENTVMFDQTQQPDFEALRQTLYDKMLNATSARAPTTNLDQLEQLANLRDKGIVTDEEFEATKRRLLELQ